MKEIITIVIRLTVSCLLAATVIGVCFIFTSNAKKHNEHVKEQAVMYELLGYSGDVTVPDTVEMHLLYRYVISGSDRQSIAYLLEKEDGKDVGDGGFILVNIDLDGAMIESKAVELSAADVLEPELRDKAVQATVGAGYSVFFADKTAVVTDNGARIAYLIGGRNQGYKTFINMMMAVDPNFSLVGFEVLEHEEDPGLGAEIEQDYFQNQLIGKPFEAIKTLDVVKQPIPSDYLDALNGKVSDEEVLAFREEYRDNDIYAITGATISTVAVTNGIKSIVTKFAYRIGVLDKVLQEQQLAVSF